MAPLENTQSVKIMRTVLNKQKEAVENILSQELAQQERGSPHINTCKSVQGSGIYLLLLYLYVARAIKVSAVS